MPGSAAALEVELFPSALPHPHAIKRDVGRYPGLFEWTTFSVFAIALALLTLHHEMWRDELQAWLIVRDSHSLGQLFHVLHYEGHPALWYLLLWVPAHFSPNPVSMQIINFTISALLAWSILSAPMLPRSIRVLIVFSFFDFYQYGAIARSYSLAMLLLVAAARCLASPRPHRKSAILLLALAINTHALAAPVAVALAAWMFYFKKVNRWRDAGRVLRDREFLTAFVALGASGIAALTTVWPAKDILGPDSLMPTIGQDFQACFSMVWWTFFPRVPSPLQPAIGPLRNSPEAACFFSVLVLVIAVMLLRDAGARLFFVFGGLMEIAAIAVTVGEPSVYRLGFVFATFVIALIFSRAHAAADVREVSRPSKRFVSVCMFLFLLPQLACGADASMLDWRRPYSGAREASRWLVTHHLDHNPLVLEPSEYSAGIIGYLGRPNAYYPSCRCYASYELRNRQRQVLRLATAEELKSVRAESQLPVILVSDSVLNPGYAAELGLLEVHSTADNALMDDEIFHIYEQIYPK